MAARKKTEDNNGVEHNDIALRAYTIYVDEGCPAGRELDHWRQAEREVLAELPPQGDGGKQPNTAKPRGRSRKKSKSGQSLRTRVDQ